MNKHRHQWQFVDQGWKVDETVKGNLFEILLLKQTIRVYKFVCDCGKEKIVEKKE